MYEFDALGTHWWCERLDGEEFPDTLLRAIDETVEHFTRAYSRFDESSLLSRLNRDGTLESPPAEMVSMMRFAREMFERTNGVFNISVGGALNALGYGKMVHGAAARRSFWDEAVISETVITIPQGVSLDFGGFGKGWLIDVLSRVCEHYGATRYIINGGGDLSVNSREPIEFALQHPIDPSQKIGSTVISRGALAASSTVKRQWQKDGKRKHHIIDPTTSDSSATDVIASFVRADSAAIADTLATVVIIDPMQQAGLEAAFGSRIILIHRDQLGG